MGVVGSGKETLFDANDSPIASLSLDRCSLPADAAGNVTSFSGAVSTLSILLSGVDDSAKWTVTVAVSGLSGSLAEKTYTVTTMTADSGYVDFTAKRAGYADLMKRFHVGKVKQGEQGPQGTWDQTPITSTQIQDGAISTPKLAANAVTAAKIDVTDLFAQNIHATGTIQGATIKNAPGNIAIKSDDAVFGDGIVIGNQASALATPSVGDSLTSIYHAGGKSVQIETRFSPAGNSYDASRRVSHWSNPSVAGTYWGIFGDKGSDSLRMFGQSIGDNNIFAIESLLRGGSLSLIRFRHLYGGDFDIYPQVSGGNANLGISGFPFHNGVFSGTVSAPSFAGIATGADVNFSTTVPANTSFTLDSTPIGVLAIQVFAASTANTAYSITLPGGGTWDWVVTYGGTYYSSATATAGWSYSGRGTSGGTGIATFNKGGSGILSGIVLYRRTA
jgi:hypothetical protein